MASDKIEKRNALRKVDISSYMEGIETVIRALSLENLRSSTVKIYQSYLIIFSACIFSVALAFVFRIIPRIAFILVIS